MAIRKILKMGDPLLRKVASQVDPTQLTSERFKNLIADMIETMQDAGGIGLAAPQIGVSLALAVIKIPENSERYEGAHESPLYIIVNPKIKVLDDQLQGHWEGCLSVPGLRGLVNRPKKIEVDYLDEEGTSHSQIFEDFLSTVVQHELDHLWGKLYLDRMEDLQTLTYTDLSSPQDDY